MPQLMKKQVIFRGFATELTTDGAGHTNTRRAGLAHAFINHIKRHKDTDCQVSTLLEYGPGMSSFRACLFSSASLALQFSHQIPLSLPGELPLPDAGDPVPKPGEPPREPGDSVPIPGEMVPGDPEKEPGEEIPDPGDGVPVELGMDPAPSGAGRVLERVVSS